MLEQQRSPSEALTVSVLNSQSQVTNKPLRDSVKQALRNYLSQLDGQDVNDLYELVLAEVEHPMLDMIMQYTRGNQTRAAIRREIERHKRYPARAKMMRKQGVVSVSFSVGADGSLSGERVTNSSGDESLDNAALEAVRSARPVGPKPAGFTSSVSVPISFTIQ